MEQTENPGPEKLTRVWIEGFRSIQEAEIKFGNATILIGANGAGKSNLIGFLQMLNYMMSDSLSLFVNERRGANSILHFGSERTTLLKGEVEFEGARDPTVYDFALRPAAGDKLIFGHERIGWGEGMMHRLRTGEFESRVAGEMLLSSNTQLGELAKKLGALLTGIQVFHFHSTSNTSGIRGLQDLRQNQSLDEQGRNLAVILYLIQQRYPTHYSRIIEEMRQILPSFLDFVLSPEPIRGNDQIELRWTSKFGKTILGPDQLSDGSIRAAALLTLLLQPDELKPGVIVIDEPELGLHPYAVGQIARLINEASVHRQIIVSTQSPRLLSEFKPEQVVVVEAKDGRSEFRHLSSEDLSSWLEQYEDLGTLFEMNVTGGAPL